MKAVLLKAHGGVDNLYLDEVPDLYPGHNEVLIEVKATALNRADILQRMGNYPPPPGASEILGLEMAGNVIGVGAHESRWKKGDRVCGLLAGGGYAQQVVTHESMLMPIPKRLTYEQAAGIPEVFLTAYQAIEWIGKLQRRDRICIHAGASGVGTAAIQVAKHIGATVFITASSGKHALCKSLGADFTIDYRAQNFAEVIASETNGLGVDLIIDFIAAPYFQQNLDALSMDGRMVMLALMGGVKIQGVNISNILRKRLHIVGSTLRARSLKYKIRLTQAFQEDYLDLFSVGKIKPVIDKVYSWKDVSAAHVYMESNLNKGKIILKVE